MLTAPELIEPQLIEMGCQVQVTPELKRGVLPDGMMRREKRAKPDSAHDVPLPPATCPYRTPDCRIPTGTAHPCSGR
jgi:hypothetical protein